MRERADNLLILGANGGVGRHLVAFALEAGFSVTALVRPQAAYDPPAGVRLVRGDWLAPDASPEALDSAMRGVDVVLSCVGMRRKNPRNPWSASLSPADLTSVSGTRISAAMGRHGVRRVVAISAAGVGDSAARLNWLMRGLLATTMIGQAYRDLAVMEQIFADSSLDWLAPRPTRLFDGPRSGNVQVVDHFATSHAISRADVAHWMLAALRQHPWPAPEWGGRTPQITGA